MCPLCLPPGMSYGSFADNSYYSNRKSSSRRGGRRPEFKPSEKKSKAVSDTKAPSDSQAEAGDVKPESPAPTDVQPTEVETEQQWDALPWYVVIRYYQNCLSKRNLKTWGLNTGMVNQCGLNQAPKKAWFTPCFNSCARFTTPGFYFVLGRWPAIEITQAVLLVFVSAIMMAQKLKQLVVRVRLLFVPFYCCQLQVTFVRQCVTCSAEIVLQGFLTLFC